MYDEDEDDDDEDEDEDNKDDDQDNYNEGFPGCNLNSTAPLLLNHPPQLVRKHIFLKGGNLFYGNALVDEDDDDNKDDKTQLVSICVQGRNMFSAKYLLCERKNYLVGICGNGLIFRRKSLL